MPTTTATVTVRSIERISSGDLVELATDVGPVPMNVGALLVLADADPAAVTAALVERAAAVPRLRQRLVRPAPGLGRPYWLEVGDLDVAAHLQHVTCPPAGGERALLDLATAAVTRPLPRDLPLWRAVVISGPTPGQVAVVVVLHHVLADGIGGLAVLADLVDGAAPGRPTGRRAARPTAGDLVRDDLARRLRGLRSAPGALATLRRGSAELGRGGGRRRAVRCSLNAPTGPLRQLTSVEVDLAGIRAGGRRHGATVNDVLLVTAAGAMAAVLGARGELVTDLVVSVPVSARARPAAGELGNQVGVMPVRVPVTGPLADRLATVAEATRARKTVTRGASAALIGPVFRTLAALGVFGALVDRQRLVNSFLTNIPGPQVPLSLAGSTVTRIVPITITAGNVGVAFAALSYAGRLGVTVIVDPTVVPEYAAMAAELAAGLAAVAAG